MKSFWVNLRLFFLLSFLTGIVYPLLITGFAQLAMKKKANGEFISFEGRMVGAKMIGQKFESEKYFWSRPSSQDYNPLPSGASNLGPTSAELKKQIEERKTNITSSDPSDDSSIPSELLYASSSGLDPHISPSAARFQVKRIAKARNLGENEQQKLLHLIRQSTTKRLLGFIGEPVVNVLELNLSLDQTFHQK